MGVMVKKEDVKLVNDLISATIPHVRDMLDTEDMKKTYPEIDTALVIFTAAHVKRNFETIDWEDLKFLVTRVWAKMRKEGGDFKKIR